MPDRPDSMFNRAVQNARIRLYRIVLSHRSAYSALRAAVAPDVLFAAGDGRVGESLTELDLNSTAVLAYFADSPVRAYQLRQWLPALEQLDAEQRVVVLLRSLDSFNLFRKETRLPLVFARRLRDLEDMLEAVDPKVCLYVNNSMQNFQPLSWRRSLHAHLNHGESDKVSMFSNQAKAYDAVLVAGEAAERRYLDNLIGINPERLVRVGRPQLDVVLPRPVEAASRPTLLYGPTWEGDTPAMEYSSVAKHGVRLVESLLAHDGFRIVYKPHPRIAVGSPPVVKAHERIVKALDAANATLPEAERHVVEMKDDILRLFAACDLLVCDISSVALDWLYLRTEAPIWLFDPYDDRERLVATSPLAASVGVIDETAMADVAALLHASLAHDSHRPSREDARRFYFGDLGPGESTKRFLEAVDELAVRRDALLEAKQAGGVEVGAGVV